jgi:hypothetical protein
MHVTRCRRGTVPADLIPLVAFLDLEPGAFVFDFVTLDVAPAAQGRTIELTLAHEGSMRAATSASRRCPSRSLTEGITPT